MHGLGMAALAAAVALASGAAAAAGPPAQSEAQIAARVARVLSQTALIDGHNDFPWEVRERFGGKVAVFDMKGDLSQGAGRAGQSRKPRRPDDRHPAAARGPVGGQFWSVYIPVEVTGAGGGAGDASSRSTSSTGWPRATRTTSSMALHAPTTSCASTRPGRIASLIGVEGGHSDRQLPGGAARSYYELGARYMTLTHITNTDWADSATDDADAPRPDAVRRGGGARDEPAGHAGRPLARLGRDDARRAARSAQAPVIFSHSSARAL